LKRRLVFLCCGILFFLAACGSGTPTPAPNLATATIQPTSLPPTLAAPTPPPGWSAYNRSAFQIALPNTWQEVKLDENNLKSAIGNAQNSNPPLAAQLNILLQSGQYKSLAFYATEKNQASIVSNVSVSPLTLSGTNDLSSFAKSYADGLPDEIRGATVVETQAPLNINGMNAASFVYNVSIVDNSGNLTTLRGVQFLYLLNSGNAYLVTMTGDAADADKFTALARNIGATFVATQ